MKRMYIRTLLFLFFSALFSLPTYGTHFMGVDMSYECIGPCSYRIYHYAYYDCNGAATAPLPGPPQIPSINFIGTPNGCSPGPVPIGSWTFLSYVEVTPVCPTAQTGCTSSGAAINGVLEGVYYHDYNFCNTSCTSFTMQWSSCCRNGVITSGAANDGIYSGSTTIDLTLVPCNSSPQFNNPPVPYICAGQTFTFNQGAFDPDGDSLSYSLGPCWDGANTQVGYNFGYSPTQPLGNTWNTQINPQTGDITITPVPNPGGGNQVVGVMCIYVTEWRNNVQIGQVFRDMQITVIPCTYTNPTVDPITNTTVGGVGTNPLSFNTAASCAGVELCFQIPSVNTNPNVTYTMFWDQSLAGGVFSDVLNPFIQDTLIGVSPIAQFCWTPPAPGFYSFLLTIQDDNCPIQGLYQATIVILVTDGLAGSTATAVFDSCNQVSFSAVPNVNLTGPFTYQWTGNSTLQFNSGTSDSSFTHLYPAPGIYSWQVVIRDTFGCISTIAGTVDVLSGAIAEAGTPVSLCSNYQYQLGANPIAGQTYSWTPATGLSNSFASNPTIQLTNPGPNPDTIDYIVQVDNGACVTYDYTSVVVFPIPNVSISPVTPSICAGDSIVLTANGATNYQWSTGATSQSITVSPTSNTTYSVVTSDNGCTSVPVYETVNVIYGPPAQVAGTFTVCPGGSSTLTATGANNYSWSNGSTSQSITLNNITNPASVYVIPDNGGCPGDTVFATVNLYDAPVAVFNSDIVCAGEATSLLDSSYITSGIIAGWEWNFGDPNSGIQNTSNLSSPTHVFTVAGTYTVQLQVTSDNGCSNIITQTITVKPVPQADFNFTNICDGNSMSFTDATIIGPGSTITNWAWDFGDGNIGTGATASHTYGAEGYYNVTLTVTSDNGCTSEYTQTVFVHPNPASDFSFTENCEGQLVNFQHLATVSGNIDFVNVWAWDFGDGNNSTTANPTHTYTTANTYTVTLTVTTNNGCTGTIQKDITVYPEPVAAYDYDFTCANENTQFTDLSTVNSATPINDWTWDFGNTLGSKSKNPVLKFSTPGTYPVTLTVTTTEGCQDEITKNIIINPVPFPNFGSSKECLGDSTIFTDLSTIDYTNIVSWTWDFGDGNGSSQQSPNHLYQNSGTYQVSLTAVSDSGCTRTRTLEAVVFSPSDAPAITEDEVCFGESAQLIAAITPPTQSYWYSDPAATDLVHTGYTYITPPLPYSTTYYVVTETGSGCRSQPFPVTASVLSPQSVSITPSTSLVELPVGLVQFAVNYSGTISSYSWNFGDGNTSTAQNPAHEYQYPGLYTVTVTIANDQGCEATAETIIEVKRVSTISIPSAFSPNDDGINDVFTIGYYNVNDITFQVYNRWGQLIFESFEQSLEWDGRTQNGTPAPEGVYVYILKGTTFDGLAEERTGTITLIR